jgi:hypothetical protein
MAEMGDVIFMETGSIRRESALRQERRWQEHNEELAKEHRRELAKAMLRCQELRKDAAKHTSKDTGKGGSYQGNKGPNLRQAGCPISDPWWVCRHCREPSPQHERDEQRVAEDKLKLCL